MHFSTTFYAEYDPYMTQLYRKILERFLWPVIHIVASILLGLCTALSFPIWSAHAFPFTNPVTVSSICLSDKPMPNQHTTVHREIHRVFRHTCQWFTLLLSEFYSITCINMSSFHEEFTSILGEDERRTKNVQKTAIPYLAYILGWVPCASRIKIGVFGLFFFMVGYARVRNDLWKHQSAKIRSMYNCKLTPWEIFMQRWRDGVISCHTLSHY